MSIKAKGNDRAIYWLHVCICIVITFGFGLLPPIAPVTPQGMSLAGIFMGMLYGWICLEIIWPSLMGLLALMLVGQMPSVEVLNRSFGDPIVQLSFFIFLFCAAIEYYGLSRLVSLWFISRKWVAGRPWLFTFMLLGSVFLLGALTSASPALIIGWSVLYGVCEMCGFKKGEGYPTMMIFGITFAAQLGMGVVPFKQSPLTIFGAFENMSGGFMIDYGKYMLLALPVCLICLVLFIFLGKYLYQPDMTRLLNLDVNRICAGAPLKMNSQQKIILAFLCLLIALLLAPGLLPPSFSLTVFLRSLGNPGIVILIITIMLALRTGKKPFIDFREMAAKGIIWNVIILLACVQPLTYAMTRKESGITQFLISIMQPLMEWTGPLGFAALISLVAFILCQIMTNAAVGIALAPIVLSYCQATATSPALPMVMIVLSIHLAFLTPAASPPAAMMHGNDWSDTLSIWKTSPLVITVSWLVILVICLTLGLMLF